MEIISRAWRGLCSGQSSAGNISGRSLTGGPIRGRFWSKSRMRIGIRKTIKIRIKIDRRAHTRAAGGKQVRIAVPSCAHRLGPLLPRRPNLTPWHVVGDSGFGAAPQVAIVECPMMLVETLASSGRISNAREVCGTMGNAGAGRGAGDSVGSSGRLAMPAWPL